MGIIFYENIIYLPLMSSKQPKKLCLHCLNGISNKDINIAIVINQIWCNMCLWPLWDFKNK